MVNDLFNIDRLRLNCLQPRLVPFLIGKPAHAVFQTHVLWIIFSFDLSDHQVSESDIGVINCLTGCLVLQLCFCMGFQLSICPLCPTRPTARSLFLSLYLSICPAGSMKVSTQTWLKFYIVEKITFMSKAAQVSRHRKGNACNMNPSMQLCEIMQETERKA